MYKVALLKQVTLSLSLFINGSTQKEDRMRAQSDFFVQRQRISVQNTVGFRKKCYLCSIL